MAETTDLRDPWLIAVWPGMGSVALLAGSYLLQQLEIQRATELEVPDIFEVQHVEVTNGISTPGRLPRNLFFEWRNPRSEHDLLVFVGEAQPESGGYVLCERVIEYAMERGVRRLFTFAAMATQLTPGTTPRVFAAATDRPALQEVREVGAELLSSGQISGLNGLLLAAGAERGLSGTCLLGELPYFAVGVPNPRAAMAVLQRFTQLAHIKIDFADLEQQAQAVDQNLEQLAEQMGQGEEEEMEFPIAQAQAEQPAPPPPQPELDARTKRRIETLFDRARQDKAKAVELKQELDRLGIFKQYEDRFLDLFRKAG